MIDKDKAKELGIKLIDSKKEQNPLYENLKTNFPQTINADGVVSLKAIAMLLGLSERADMQGYELTFSGKGLANALYSTPTTKELKLEEVFYPKYLYKGDCQTEGDKPEESQALPCHSEGVRSTTEESHKLDSNNAEALYRPNATHTRNAIIRGDNLDVLKLLKSAYSEKIKMIYIDPPYNTKNDNFIYPDDFRKDYQAILREVGLLLEDENGEWVESETLRFFRNITGSKSHSGWLAFMLPRLKLARDLLREDGVIFISIDDNEQANLKILCDEIFGEENFVSCFVWQKKSGGGSATLFYEGHEYILIYAKDKSLMQGLFKVKNKSNIETDFLRKIHGKYTNNAKLKAMYEKYPNKLIQHRNLMFEEMDIFLQEKMITQAKYNEIKQNLANGTYFLKAYNDNFNLICRYNVENKSLMYSIITGVWTSDGNTEIENIFGYDDIFNDPKPTFLLKQLIQSITMKYSNNTAQEGNYVAGGG
ncbi:site-specific DNA-methyltransferase, partial [Campylobacter sp. MIT 97-5078]|uniref:site-specific DNA-methyltransferase n=1 Tax=Campylobacter sp. MIT 97-5078 TaxID=1548153 RepID=UPI001E340EF4